MQSVRGMVYSISPQSIPADQSVQVTVTGNGFNDGYDYTCAFVCNYTAAADYFWKASLETTGCYLTVHAQILNSSTAQCTVSQWNFPAYSTAFFLYEGPMKVASNRTLLQFNFSDGWIKADDKEVAAASEKELVVHGFGFNPQMQYSCKFTGADFAILKTAHNVTLSSMHCPAPFWNHTAEVVILEILLGERILYKRGGAFEILFYESVKQVSPVEDTDVAAMITAHGAGFSIAGRYRFTFKCPSQNIEIASEYGTYVNPSTLVFKLPPWETSYCSTEVSLVNGDINVLPLNPLFFVYQSYCTSVQPSQSLAIGGSLITLRGHRFDTNVICTFSIQDFETNVTANFLDHTSVTCKSPTVPYASGIGILRAIYSQRAISYCNYSFEFLRSGWDSIFPSHVSSNGTQILKVGGEGLSPPAGAKFELILHCADDPEYLYKLPCAAKSDTELECPMKPWESVECDTSPVLLVNGSMVGWYGQDRSVTLSRVMRFFPPSHACGIVQVLHHMLLQQEESATRS
eukprot:766394-Hanusia_phi.AAC.3